MRGLGTQQIAGAEWYDRQEVHRPSLGRSSFGLIGQHLRVSFSEVLGEPLPEGFLRALQRLAENESRHMPCSEPDA